MIYEIKVSGALDQSWSDWLGSVQVNSHALQDGSTLTTLTGCASDQAALFGILDRIRDLNIGLISVNTVETPSTPDEGSEGRKKHGQKN